VLSVSLNTFFESLKSSRWIDWKYCFRSSNNYDQ